MANSARQPVKQTGRPFKATITALNTLLAAAEIHWFFGCIRSLDNTALAHRVYGNPIGRVEYGLEELTRRGTVDTSHSATSLK